MGGLRLATWAISLALHAALALPFLTWAGGDQSAFEEGVGADLLKIEQGLALEGVAQTGMDAQNVEAIEGQTAVASQAVPETIEELKPEEPPQEEPPPDQPEVKDVPELTDVITAKAEQVEESVVTEEVRPEPIKEIKPQQIAAAASVEEISVKELKAAAQAQEGGDASARTAYLGKLQRHISAHKVNPRTNRRGTVIVRFTVSPTGQLLSREITKSSGSEQLDKAALAALDKAAPFPPFPKGVVNRELAVSVPFRFLTR
ncbi:MULTISPECIES: TonB family protein [Filomicrobium]|uniref:Protein TonB n=1 Tax=Filomicrobium insigne TaxID=418854 RepID=A0A1H0J256_9HYPH|nr:MULTISPECIES: TonB family protein [Filomicrobium]MCV0368408.1 TonB family protein [Filomicrobium sp.]SDO37868.1 protein TonB [Filomicrobium insigne]